MRLGVVLMKIKGGRGSDKLIIYIIFKSKMRKINGADVEVTRDDQNNINSFSKFYQKRQELD